VSALQIPKTAKIVHLSYGHRETLKIINLLNKPNFLTILFLVVWLPLLVLAGLKDRFIENFTQPSEPFFEGNYAGAPPAFTGQLKVITWNISYAEKIETAIAELSTVAELQAADIILLQEMDEAGAETIAQTLKYNYVYYPASIHSHHNRNFGNAILSKWPLSDPVKLLLPYENLIKQRRIAVRATVTLGQTEVLVYSIHTETIWLAKDKRMAQVETITKDISQQPEAYVLAGGDFNTTTQASIREIEELFAQVGMARVSAEAGPSVVIARAPFWADHIFARNMLPLAAGVWPATQASDHSPVWVEISLAGINR
jgi:endonuclease/exonuclease/phosphatase family metal-dependent hydrolase